MNAPLPFDELFNADFLSRLQHLSLRLSRAQRGGRLAEQRTTARGQGLEFADYKPYIAGDDLRAVDWHIYKRLGRLFVRTFEEQQDLPVYFLLDLSASMFVESPPRINSALRAIMALAAIALAQQDNITLLTASDSLEVSLKSLSGKNNTMRVATTLSEYQAQGQGQLGEVLKQVSQYPLRRGLLVVVSDFFDSAGSTAVAQQLQQIPHKLLLLQLSKDYDADPRRLAGLSGEVSLDDGEQAPLNITINANLMNRYQQAYQQHQDILTKFASDYGAGFLKLDCDTDELDQLSDLLGSGGPLL
ncbi:DUF58 domain-containing protein [Idiomarina sp. M1R2S28]|uniref:DUF58 domain-containing protein n=1 Tax=Idiomarina rhizosphaerae TaxID=2961572 RepID=A0A9X2JS33_9GAMM|nr:DUF58 domain-containing protein [Idiomarina rhizosphaerae]MCP1338325.1 DUF58 domain-containing protein [Idiomarina rhizosphaerae]